MYGYEFDNILRNLEYCLRGRTLDMEQAKKLAEVIIAHTVKEKNCGHYGCVNYAYCRYAQVHISEVAFWPDIHKMMVDSMNDLANKNTLVNGDVEGSTPDIDGYCIVEELS